MKKLLETPEIIAALITVAGTLLVNVMLSFLERRVGLETVVVIVVALLLGLLLFLLHKRTGARVTAGATAATLVIGFLIFLALGRPWPASARAPPTSTTAAPSAPTTEMALPSATPHPPSGAGPTSTPPLAATPALSPESEAAALPVEEYALPLGEPWDVDYDGSDLWVLFHSLLVRTELVEAEGRFRVAEQKDFPRANSLDWDASRGQYWAVSGAAWSVGEEIDLIDAGGNKTATFTVPQTFVGSPRCVAWDGEYLHVTSDSGSLFKLQPAGDSPELGFIDSYAPSIGGEVEGVTWDGAHLWLLDGDI